MTTIYCSNLGTNCKINISNDYAEAMKQLNKRGWMKVGKGLNWDYFCPIHAKEKRALKMKLKVLSYVTAPLDYHRCIDQKGKVQNDKYL